MNANFYPLLYSLEHLPAAVGVVVGVLLFVLGVFWLLLPVIMYLQLRALADELKKLRASVDEVAQHTRPDYRARATSAVKYPGAES